jgi:hydrogenase expression/formation protein HypE
MIIEEGMSIDALRTIARSMGAAAAAAEVRIVTGDTKVVPRGASDKLFSNTAGVGVIPQHIRIDAQRAAPGDLILINGYIGNHGAAILNARGDLAIESSIESDSAALNHLIKAMLQACPDIHCMRDATRGGVATVVNEFAQSSQHCLRLDEETLPVRDDVRGMCEILGLDPLYMANEGKLVAVVPKEAAASLLEVMRAQELGRDAAIIGEVLERDGDMVVLKTTFGGERIVDMLVGEQLPRIC